MKAIFLRLIGAALSGVLVYVSYEPLGWSWAAILGMTLFIACLLPGGTTQVSTKLGMALGVSHFLTLYLLLLPWVGEFVGMMPFLALASYLALFGIVLGGLGVHILKLRYGLWLFAFFFTAVEWLRSNYPFGGFAWVRLAWGQINSPLAAWVSIGGPALVTLLTVFIACTLCAVAFRRLPLKQVLSAVVLVTVFTISINVHLGSGDNTGEVRVAAIQGNVPRMGLDFNAQRRAVLGNHVNQTLTLPIAEKVDLVIWPENASDVNPFADAEASRLITGAVDQLQVPILVGTITADQVGPRNTMVVFDPKTGVGDYHYKKFLQPFGEYMPWRGFFRLFSKLVDQAGNFQPGMGNGTVSVTAAQSDKNVVVGIATCYEIAFDQASRDAVNAGAEILTSPTNNATFGFTDMTYQQLGMSRMRAMELDRAVVVAATSGVSAIVHPDGSVSQHTEIFTADTLIETLPLRNTITIAARFGYLIESLLVIMGWLVAVAAIISNRRNRATAVAPHEANPVTA